VEARTPPRYAAFFPSARHQLLRIAREPHGSGLGTVRCLVEHANAWLLANQRLDRRSDRLTSIIDALLTTACIFVIANQITD
jgi:hypothetical protein